MKLPFFIASRYLFSKKSTNAINVIAGVSVVGMGLGAFALIVVLSVFNGFESLVLDLQNSFYSDVVITPKEGKVFTPNEQLIASIKDIEEVEGYAFSLQENAYLRYKDQSTLAVVKGVDKYFFNVTDVNDYLIAGSDELIKDGVQYAVLGAGIDYALGTNVAMPIDPITISVPKRGKSNAVLATQLFNNGQVMPGGVFGIQTEFDSKYIFVDIDMLRKVLKYKNEVSAIEVSAKDGASIKVLQNNLKIALGDNFEVTPRYEQDKALYEVMRVERYAVIAILTLILFIISFNIIGSLSMLAMEKKKDIAILKSMGATDGLIQRIFMLEGALGSILGALSGLLLGLLIVGLQYYFGFIKLGGGGFVVSAYPVEVHWFDILLAFVLVTSISLAAAYYPAKRAAKQNSLLVH